MHWAARKRQAEHDPKGPAAAEVFEWITAEDPRPGRGGHTQVDRPAPEAPPGWLGMTLDAYAGFRRNGILPAAGGLHDQTVWIVEAFGVLDDELARLGEASEKHDEHWRKQMPSNAA